MRRFFSPCASSQPSTQQRPSLHRPVSARYDIRHASPISAIDAYGSIAFPNTVEPVLARDVGRYAAETAGTRHIQSDAGRKYQAPDSTGLPTASLALAHGRRTTSAVLRSGTGLLLALEGVAAVLIATPDSGSLDAHIADAAETTIGRVCSGACRRADDEGWGTWDADIYAGGLVRSSRRCRRSAPNRRSSLVVPPWAELMLKARTRPSIHRRDYGRVSLSSPAPGMVRQTLIPDTIRRH
jgi:hypothetical protein